MSTHENENDEFESVENEDSDALRIPVAGFVTGPTGTTGMPPISTPAAAGLAAVAIGEEMDAEDRPPSDDDEAPADIDYEGLKEFAHADEAEESERP